jgi:hypothetical protein
LRQMAMTGRTDVAMEPEAMLIHILGHPFSNQLRTKLLPLARNPTVYRAHSCGESLTGRYKIV